MTEISLLVRLVPRIASDPGFQVEYTVAGLAVAAGEPLLRAPLTIVSLPGIAQSDPVIDARDDEGPLALTFAEEVPTATATYRRWTPVRATSGDIRVSYFAPVRQVDASTPGGPLFDLRAQSGGLFGAGISFLVLPVVDGALRVQVEWQVEAEVATVTSRGEGDISWTGPIDTLQFMYFAAGDLKRHPATGDAGLSIQWFGDAPFDVSELTRFVGAVFAELARMFRTEGSDYRVFIRSQPAHGGGTAVPDAFAFGHADSSPVDARALRWLLAHEISHNWPKLDGDHGDTAWYSEGAAEYYSLLASLRAGLADEDAVAAELDTRLGAYVANPFHTASNSEAAEQFWRDRDAQRLPYGRGLAYLLLVDAQLRDASEGARTLDDLVVEVNDRQRGGAPFGLDEWVALVGRHLGVSGVAEFEAMRAGELLPLPAVAFDGRLTRVMRDDLDADARWHPAAVANGERR